MYIHALYHKKMYNFLKITSSKFVFVTAKNTFEPNVFKCVLKMNFTNFNSFLKKNHQR